jgi:cyanophycin synthetase
MTSTNLSLGAHQSAEIEFPAYADIQIVRTTYLRGPNMWTYREVLEVWLDLGVLENWPSNLIPGFNDRLIALLPGVAQHHCGVGHEGGFLLRLQTGTWLGHVLEHVIIELLNLSGMPTGFGQTRSTSTKGVYRMVFRARDEQVGLTALKQGHALLSAVLQQQEFDVVQAVQLLRDCIDECYLGPSTACIVAAATERRIPHIRLNEGNLVQLGHGVAQRRIWTAETDFTSAIAEGIAGDKDLTKSLLRSCGVPIPEGRLVGSPDAAWEAASDMGLPVVVKPTDGNHGRGVSLCLSAQSDIQEAFMLAQEHGSEVMVEPFIEGNEHRVLVVGNEVVAVAKGVSAWVVGDGVSTVRTLIDQQLNSDPRRGTTEDCPLNLIMIDEDEVGQLELKRQGLTPGSVPIKDQNVLIQHNGNVAFDCTDEIHPDVAALCVLAAQKIGLDIAGIDLVTKDISQPFSATGGAIVEVNAGPGLLMHLKPAEGPARPVGQAIVNHLFSPDQSGRIPIVGVTGTHGTQHIAQLLAWFIHLDGTAVGMANQNGLYVGARCIDKQTSAHWHAAQRLLINRHVEAAVIETNPLHILTEGLAYDRCDVGIVTDLDDNPGYAQYDVTTADQRFKVLRTQIDVVHQHGAAVLNAADESILPMAELCDGATILYSINRQLEVLHKHQLAGGRVVYLDDTGDSIVLAEGFEIQGYINISQFKQQPFKEQTHGVLLASMAGAWALNIPLKLIQTGVDTFDYPYIGD